MSDPVYLIAASLMLSYVFVDVGQHKLRHQPHYSAVIEAYRILPRALSKYAAVLIGALEVAVGIAVLVPQSHAVAVNAMLVLLSLYVVAIAVNLARGRTDIDCGCGGPMSRQSISGWLLPRNSALIAIALLAIFEVTPRVINWLDWTVAILAAAAGTIVYNTINLLLSNKSRLGNL